MATRETRAAAEEEKSPFSVPLLSHAFSHAHVQKKPFFCASSCLTPSVTSMFICASRAFCSMNYETERLLLVYQYRKHKLVTSIKLEIKSQWCISRDNNYDQSLDPFSSIMPVCKFVI